MNDETRSAQSLLVSSDDNVGFTAVLPAGEPFCPYVERVSGGIPRCPSSTPIA
jgi:hypothetical protein